MKAAVLCVLAACAVAPAERLHTPKALPEPGSSAPIELEPFPAGVDLGWSQLGEVPAWPHVVPSLLPHGPLPADPCTLPQDAYARAWCKPEWRSPRDRLDALSEVIAAPDFRESFARADLVDLLADSMTGAEALAYLAEHRAPFEDWDALVATYLALDRRTDAATIESATPQQRVPSCDRLVRREMLVGEKPDGRLAVETNSMCADRIAQARCAYAVAYAAQPDWESGCRLYFRLHPAAQTRAVRAQLAAGWPTHVIPRWRDWDEITVRAFAVHADDVAAAALVNLSRTAACNADARRELSAHWQTLRADHPDDATLAILARVHGDPACDARPSDHAR